MRQTTNGSGDVDKDACEILMHQTLAYAGVPTSLGSYSPGQEKAPGAFRSAGFPDMLRKEGLNVMDCGDLPVRRWCPDKETPLSQHWKGVVAPVQETERHLSKSLTRGRIPIVIGRTCTIEFGW